MAHGVRGHLGAWRAVSACFSVGIQIDKSLNMEVSHSLHEPQGRYKTPGGNISYGTPRPEIRPADRCSELNQFYL